MAQQQLDDIISELTFTTDVLLSYREYPRKMEKLREAEKAAIAARNTLATAVAAYEEVRSKLQEAGGKVEEARNQEAETYTAKTALECEISGFSYDKKKYNNREDYIESVRQRHNAALDKLNILTGAKELNVAAGSSNVATSPGAPPKVAGSSNVATSPGAPPEVAGCSTADGCTVTAQGPATGINCNVSP